MPAPTHFNHRSDEGAPGGTDLSSLNHVQSNLLRYLKKRDKETLALMLLNHTTQMEQFEMERVYRTVVRG